MNHTRTPQTNAKLTSRIVIMVSTLDILLETPANFASAEATKLLRNLDVFKMKLFIKRETVAAGNGEAWVNSSLVVVAMAFMGGSGNISLSRLAFYCVFRRMHCLLDALRRFGIKKGQGKIFFGTNFSVVWEGCVKFWDLRWERGELSRRSIKWGALLIFVDGNPSKLRRFPTSNSTFAIFRLRSHPLPQHPRHPTDCGLRHCFVAWLNIPLGHSCLGWHLVSAK
jgi:hypothetical protein